MLQQLYCLYEVSRSRRRMVLVTRQLSQAMTFAKVLAPSPLDETAQFEILVLKIDPAGRPHLD